MKDSLELTLELTVAGRKFEIPGANIKSLVATIQTYGFSVQLGFWLSEERDQDDLLPQFVRQDPITVKLELLPHFKPKNENIEALNLEGFVTDKELVQELTIDNVNLKGAPVLYRHYRIEFADPAQVVWKQHYPCDLQVDCSVKDLIEENNPADVKLDFDWQEFEKIFAINTLPCLHGAGKASFYDFVLGYAETMDAVFSYDLIANRYSLSQKKKNDQAASEMRQEEVANIRIKFPSSIRYNDRLLNAFSEQPEIKKTSRADTLPGVMRDILIREPISSEFENAFELETQKQRSRKHVLQLQHSRFPQLSYRPGSLFTFTGGLWSDKLFTKDNKYRVISMHIVAQADKSEPDADLNMPYTVYRLDMTSILETEAEEAPNYPEFKEPLFPVQVEGRVLSEQGGEDDDSWQVYEHPQQMTDQYRVVIPTFEDRQVVVPFEPLFAPGTFYFPAYKDQRVLVELDFHRARIVRFLDWRSGGRLPMDSQGDHLLLGKNQQSNTSISHVYVDNKPQLKMKRTSSDDTEVIQLEEGNIILETREEQS